MQYGTNVNVRLPQATLDAIDKEAEAQSRTRSNLIRKILDEWVQRRVPDDAPPFPFVEIKQMVQEMSEDEQRNLRERLKDIVRQKHERRHVHALIMDTHGIHEVELKP